MIVSHQVWLTRRNVHKRWIRSLPERAVEYQRILIISCMSSIGTQRSDRTSWIAIASNWDLKEGLRNLHTRVAQSRQTHHSRRNKEYFVFYEVPLKDYWLSLLRYFVQDGSEASEGLDACIYPGMSALNDVTCLKWHLHICPTWKRTPQPSLRRCVSSFM